MGGAGQGPASWQEIHATFRALVEEFRGPRRKEQLEPMADFLSVFADDVLKLLETHIKTRIQQQ